MPADPAEFIDLQRTLLGRYSLDRELGRGGMGIVFLARDVALDRPVAIKLLPPAFAGNPEFRTRFLREARTAAQLSHPNIVPIHLVEEHGDIVFFVMAYVEGESLGQRVRRAGPLPPSTVSRIVRDVAWALGYAHERGVIHRDVKPDNILIEAGSGRAMVTDFGIARVAETGTMTGRGELIGTVQYMSPEQATGEVVDGRSDLYSLGVTAFYCLTGRLPFDGANVPAIIHKQVTLAPPRVAGLAPKVPARLAEAVDRCLAKDASARFRSCTELAEALGSTIKARAELLPELRHFLRVLRDTGVAGGIGFVAAMWLGVFSDELGAAMRSMPLFQQYALGLALIVSVGGVIGTLFRATRRVLRAGISKTEVRNALYAEAEELEEEQAIVYGSRGIERRGNREMLFRWGPVAIAFGLFVTGAGVVMGDFGAVGLGSGVLLGGLLGWGAGPVQPEDSPLRALGFVERLAIGRFGRLLFRTAGIGLEKPAVEAAALDERTEALLRSAADDLFDGLPSDVRRRFPEVPDDIQRLEKQAAALRKREEVLSDAIARVDAVPAGGQAGVRRKAAEELEQSRESVRVRLAAAVTALENVRLDLLRLHAGVGSPDDLTADLLAAKEIGAAVDAQLEGIEAVSKLLRSPTPT